MSKIKKIIPHIIFITLYLVFVIIIRFQPLTQTFEFDYDEGINLIKANLFQQGFSLYNQTWNDQPPLFTILLSFWLKIFGQSIIAARLLVLLFSSLLIWSFFQIIKHEFNQIVAILSTFLLFTSWMFIRLSISVMIGIPAIALMMLAIYLIKHFQVKSNLIWLSLSGIIMGLSLQTKLFTIILILLLILEITNYQILSIKNNPRKLYLALFWLTHVLLVYLVIGITSGSIFNHDQTILSHFQQSTPSTHNNFDNQVYLQYMLGQDWDYLFLAFLGIILICQNPQKKSIIPIGWCAIALIMLLFHRPIWYHHYTLLIVPVCWLAAVPINWLIKFFKTYQWRYTPVKKQIFSLTVIFAFILLVILTPPVSRGKPPKDMQVMQLLLQHQSATNWLFTDRPIYAFYAQLPIPPEIAVLSYKRLNSGNFSSQNILAILQKYRPEQIVLGRWNQSFLENPVIMNYIQANYEINYSQTSNNTIYYPLKSKKLPEISGSENLE